MNNASFFITTHDSHRLQVWRRLFRSYRLPVKSAVPRWQLIPGHRHEISAYDLDASRLLPKQVARFRRYVAKVQGISEVEAEGLLDGWPIPAARCELCS